MSATEPIGSGPVPVRWTRGITLLVVALLAGCGSSDQAPTGGGAGDDGDAAGERFTDRTFERTFVFVSVQGDSTFIVPWMMRTVSQRDSVMREARAWLARGDDWDDFFAERWWTPPTREPARLLPRDGLTILVRDGNAIDGLMFEEGPRSLELVLGESTESWTDARGGSFEVLTGSAYLSDQRVEGRVLDVSRASAADESPGGDWAFLVSGDSAAFVLAADAEHGGETEPTYRGWGTGGSTRLQWPDVTLTWSRTQAFPPARRDVPVEWNVRDSEGELGGALTAISAEMQAGEGPGPLLPVRALFAVEGALDTDEGQFPVRGLLVHERR